MRQLINSFLWIGCLALGLQPAWAFSLLGPEGNGGDAWQVVANGYNPLVNAGAPPFFLESLLVGPKNLGEGYRRTTPVMYYTFDATFGDFFGTNGEFAVQQAFDVLNGLTNVDSYSTSLAEFPLNSQSENFQANALGLADLKSTTLSLLMEQLGLADAVRYLWVLHDRRTLPGCTGPCPACMEYLVAIRNFNYFPTPLNQSQYSAYINNELYTYFIDEICSGPAAPPNADALELPADPLQKNYPVASGNGEGFLVPGFFYTGLTRDDVAGLRWLYSTNNFDTPSSGFRESSAPGSSFFSTNFNATQLLFTSNFNALAAAALTNNPTALQALFPGLVVNPNPPSYFTNMVSIGNVSFVVVFPIGYPGGIIAAVTNYVTNIVQVFQNSFGNVVTNKVYPKTSFAVQTITFGPQIGQPADSPFVLATNTSPVFQSNVVSGDYFIITNGTCAPNFIQTFQTNVNIVTNNSVAVLNPDGSFFIQNLISYFTNYVFVVQPCTLVTNALGDYQGLSRMQFVRVRDDNYDYQNGQFVQPITNQYTMVVITNKQAVTQTFQRVLTAPDFVFGAQDLASGPTSGDAVGEFLRAVNFNQANIQPNLAGPGTIDPGSSNVILFNKSGPIFYNESTPSFLSGPNGAFMRSLVWGSFDGTTNPPVVYPNGTSLANLAASALIQISPPPPTLPNGVKGVPYNVQLTATNATGSLTWTLASGSAGLPPGSPGLTLSPGGLISGTPTNSATYDNIVIQMMDSSVPPRTVQMIYSLTIN